MKKLVLIDSAGYPLQSTSVPLGFTIARTPGLRVVMEYVLPRGVVQSSVRNVYGDPAKVTAELVDRYYELTLRAGNRQALAYRMDQLHSGDEAALKGLKVPTLVMWGAKDRLIPPDTAQRFVADIAGAQMVIFDDLGHVPHEEDGPKTVEAFKLFMSAR